MLPAHPPPAVPSSLINLLPAILRLVQQSRFLPKKGQGKPRQTSNTQRCEYKSSSNTMPVDVTLCRILHLSIID